MKIAIASLGKNIDSEISPQAGRSPFFLIFEDGKLIEVWKNIFSIGGGGAGTSVAKVLSDKGVVKIIGGKFGDNMIQAMKNKNIEFEEKGGIVKKIIHFF